MSDEEDDITTPLQHFPKPPAPVPQPKPSPLSLVDNAQPFLLLLDNYDSFTYNLYQYLSQLGARCLVLRNDDLTAADFGQLNVSHLVVSPGPGHPRTDSGVSREAIKYWAGKVPVLGVCMGLQCLVDAFGGDVAPAGEIVHGKASPIRHDGLGIFKGVPQNVLATRYHSLAASLPQFPAELAVTATTADSGIVMGARHRNYTVEAVQYHPESILSHDGHAVLRNFLSYTGGTWAQNPQSGVSPPSQPQPQPAFDPSPSNAALKSLPSILSKIQQQRLLDVDLAKRTPGTTLADLAVQLNLHLAPPLLPVLPRMLSATAPGVPAIMAEIKRASPSKGPIALTTSAPAQARAYALAGAAVISVLTEPTWFLGSLQDLRLAREAVAHLPNRPALLRKDFILDEYQLLEARLAGADTALLIVAMLPQERLAALYAYSKSLGMEPLVEVNNAAEMTRALELGAKLIGVNNRNLHDFAVDMGTTTRLAEMTASHPDVVLCALSGISSRADVEAYTRSTALNVRAVLVGEALMRAPDPAAFMRSLIGVPAPPPPPAVPFPKPLVKICGIRTPEEALLAAHAGADMLGLNFVPSSKRAIDIPTGALIARSILPLRLSPSPSPLSLPPNSSPSTWFNHTTSHLSALPRPLLVGLFLNAPLSTILSTLASVPLDLVQLHGSEPAQLAQFIPVPVIKAYHVGPHGTGVEHVGRAGCESVVLLDTASTGGSNGGSGETFDWSVAADMVSRGERDEGAMPLMLAGGLTPENVRAAVRRVRPWAVDVASGVEREGRKEEGLVRAFVGAVKGAWEEAPAEKEGEQKEVNGEQKAVPEGETTAEEPLDAGVELGAGPIGAVTAAPAVPTPPVSPPPASSAKAAPSQLPVPVPAPAGGPLPSPPLPPQAPGRRVGNGARKVEGTAQA